MNKSLIIVTYSLIFHLSFSTLLFFYLILRRIIVENQDKRFQEKYQKIEKDILQIITSPEEDRAEEVAKKYQSFPYVLTKVLVNYVEQIEGLAKEQLKKIFDYALKDKCLRDIYSRRQVKRLKATYLFVIFSGHADTDHILKLLNDRPVVKLVAINALSRIPTSQTIAYIFQAFERDHISNARTYINIMYGLGDRIGSHVKKYLNMPLPLEKLALLIEIVGAIPLRSLYQDIVRFAEHSEKEIRIKVARALGHLRIPASLDILIALSEDEAWEVCAQALKSLGKLGDLKATEVLFKATFSPFWHVRFNAGHALASLGTSGIRYLKKIKRQDKDRYASDMAAMVLDEIIFAGEG
jgi:hypothetical protein